MTDISAEQIAVEASAPRKFSLIERLQNRNYPNEDVTIYLAEDAAYTKSVLEEEAASTPAGEQLDAIHERIEELNEIIKGSGAVINIRAISSARYDELVKDATKAYPVKYEKVQNPLTGKVTLEEVASPDREELFSDLYLGEVITSATIGDEVDDAIDAEWFRQFKVVAPLDGVRIVVEKAYKMRMVTEWMDEIQNEDF